VDPIPFSWEPFRQRCASRLLAALLATSLQACGNDTGAQPDGPPPIAVQIATAVAAPLPRTLDAVGTLESSEQTVVAAEQAAQVLDIDIPEGRLVQKGHVLVQLDAGDAAAALKVARARLESAKTRRARIESLRASNVSSDQALEDAVTAFREAEGQVDQAAIKVSKLTIRAPFAGIVGLRRIQPGQYIQVGEPVVELTRVDPLQLVFSVPQRHASELENGQHVLALSGRCGERFEGDVTAVEPMVDAATRTVKLKAEIPNPEGRLRPGMAASVRLVLQEIPEAIRIPHEAIIRQGARYFVYVVDAEEHARQRTVELGTFFVDSVQVRDGVKPGERVVVAGHQKLSPGAAVQSEPYEPVHNPTLDLGWFGPAEDCAS
jgi:membrane fusion protein, multidrug efflux system